MWSRIGLIVLVIFSAVVIFWNLGNGSLAPWDEAWYGSITRNMLQNGDFFNLSFNQQPYNDHPPLGFQLKAISVFLLGESSFSVRLPEAIMGLICIVLVFLIGKRLSSSWAGLWSGLILLSSRWFLFRSRTGNLDVLLLGTQLLVILALVSALFGEKNSSKNLSSKNYLAFFKKHVWIFLSWWFLGISLLSKALISLQLLPMVILSSAIYWYRNYNKVRESSALKFVFTCILGAVIPLMPWIVISVVNSGSQFIKRQFQIGFRSDTQKSLELAFIKKTLGYFHAAVHRWYKVMLGSTGMLIGFLFSKKIRCKSLFLVFYAILSVGPYFVSPRTEVWHLVPLIGAMAILTGVSLDLLINIFYKSIPENFRVSIMLPLIRLAASFSIVILASIALFNYSVEFLNTPDMPSDFEKITWHIINRHKDLYLTIDDYFPSIVYYANLDRASVKYITRDKYIATCSASIKQNGNISIIDNAKGWLSSQIEPSSVVAKEGSLVLIDSSLKDCNLWVK